MAQRNLMKRRYLVVTRCKLTLYYQWSLEARENESKEARAHDPGGPYIGGKLRVDLWGEKVVCDWKGSKQLESLENHTFQEASRHLHLLCLPNASGGAQLCQQDPLYLPGDLSPTCKHNSSPGRPQAPTAWCHTHRHMATQYLVNSSFSLHFKPSNQTSLVWSDTNVSPDWSSQLRAVLACLIPILKGLLSTTRSWDAKTQDIKAESSQHLCDSSWIKMAGGQVRQWKEWAGFIHLPASPQIASLMS